MTLKVDIIGREPGRCQTGKVIRALAAVIEAQTLSPEYRDNLRTEEEILVTGALRYLHFAAGALECSQCSQAPTPAEERSGQ